MWYLIFAMVIASRRAKFTFIQIQTFSVLRHVLAFIQFVFVSGIAFAYVGPFAILTVRSTEVTVVGSIGAFVYVSTFGSFDLTALGLETVVSCRALAFVVSKLINAAGHEGTFVSLLAFVYIITETIWRHFKSIKTRTVVTAEAINAIGYSCIAGIGYLTWVRIVQRKGQVPIDQSMARVKVTFVYIDTSIVLHLETTFTRTIVASNGIHAIRYSLIAIVGITGKTFVYVYAIEAISFVSFVTGATV